MPKKSPITIKVEYHSQFHPLKLSNFHSCKYHCDNYPRPSLLHTFNSEICLIYSINFIKCLSCSALLNKLELNIFLQESGIPFVLISLDIQWRLIKLIVMLNLNLFSLKMLSKYDWLWESSIEKFYSYSKMTRLFLIKTWE